MLPLGFWHGPSCFDSIPRLVQMRGSHPRLGVWARRDKGGSANEASLELLRPQNRRTSARETPPGSQKVRSEGEPLCVRLGSPKPNDRDFFWTKGACPGGVLPSAWAEVFGTWRLKVGEWAATTLPVGWFNDPSP